MLSTASSLHRVDHFTVSYRVFAVTHSLLAPMHCTCIAHADAAHLVLNKQQRQLDRVNWESRISCLVTEALYIYAAITRLQKNHFGSPCLDAGVCSASHDVHAAELIAKFLIQI